MKCSSEYVSNQYVQTVGWFKKSYHLIKRFKFAVVVLAISLIESH